MSRDKQTEIEEMTIALTESQHEFDKAWKECLHNNAPMPDRENVFYAKYLVEKEGYRKSTELAEEIFAEIEKIAMHGTTVYGLCLMSMGEAAFAELKKKYESEKENE
jgi:hypothetical protein